MDRSYRYLHRVFPMFILECEGIYVGSLSAFFGELSGFNILANFFSSSLSLSEGCKIRVLQSEGECEWSGQNEETLG